MKCLKKVLIMLFITAFVATSALPVCAANKVWSPNFTIDNVTATEGDTVFVNINLSNNTDGIMAMTFSILYDDNVLSYVGYRKGKLVRILDNGSQKNYSFSGYYIVEHIGHISIVDCENKNNFGDGTILTLEFTVKSGAYAGTYPIKMAHVRPNEKGESLKGCFANWQGDTITPTLTNGSITIPLTQQNCRHSFGAWEVKTPADCVQEGVEVRNCSVCGKAESRTVAKTEHSFEDFWTIDSPATAEDDGVMSRHCKNCNKTTDVVFFPYEAPADYNFNNDEGTVVSGNQVEKFADLTTAFETEEKEDEPVTVQPPQDTQAVAQELVESKKEEQEEKNGIAGKIYLYLFGDDGIIKIILKALNGFLKNLSIA